MTGYNALQQYNDGPESAATNNNGPEKALQPHKSGLRSAFAIRAKQRRGSVPLQPTLQVCKDVTHLSTIGNVVAMGVYFYICGYSEVGHV